MSDPRLAKKVVFAPGLIGAALIDPRARALLDLWRDGQIKPVTNRDLLMLHLKNLRDLGVTRPLIERWTLWLTDPTRSDYLRDLASPPGSIIQLCNKLALAAQAQAIICWRNPPPNTTWTTAAKFLTSNRTS